MGIDKETKKPQATRLNVKLGIGASLIGLLLATVSVCLYARDAYRAASNASAAASTPAATSALAPAAAANCRCEPLPAVSAAFSVNAFHMVVLCLWIFVPPVWFALETYITDPQYKNTHLRKSQEMYSRIWVAVSVMLAALASASK